MTSLSSDTGAFFSEADGFTVAAALNGGAELQVLFDNGYLDALDVASAAPSATCRTADVVAAVQGDTLTVDGTDYTVRSVEPDGAGVTVLRLHRG